MAKKQTDGNLALEQQRVIVIPAHDEIVARKLRVAAYARVSSSSEDQLNSYRVQNQYYSELISGNPDWEMVDIYADEGITGTSVEKREDFQRKQFDSYEETQMLLPLTVLYYKLNQFDKAEDYIKRLAKANKDAKKFLRAAERDQLDDYIDEMNPYGYQPFTMEELLDELMKSSYLFDSVLYFFVWASKVLTAKSGTKKNTRQPHLLN